METNCYILTIESNAFKSTMEQFIVWEMHLFSKRYNAISNFVLSDTARPYVKFKVTYLEIKKCTPCHGRRQREAEGRGSPLDFIHGTNIVYKGLKVLFFGVFFLLFFGPFFRCPPEEA